MPSVLQLCANLSCRVCRANGRESLDNPKNWRNSQRLVRHPTDQDSIVVDFFAGSGSSAHAVMAQNALDGGKRCFVMVQLDEDIDEVRRRSRKDTTRFRR